MPGFIGLPELLLLGLVVLILFGPKRLPEMGRSLGHGLREFKDSVGGDAKGGGDDLLHLEVPRELTEAPAVVVEPIPATRERHVA
jgi:sec-independent protein translocase protein TatA